MLKAKRLSELRNIQHAFFGRVGGVSKGSFGSLNTSVSVGDEVTAVKENRRRVCEQLARSANQLFVPKQVHGDAIVRVGPDSNPEIIESTEADAIWTTEARVLVGVQTADCAPLLLADKMGSAVMAVHLGWRGAANGLAKKAVHLLCTELKIAPKELVAAIGPCIGFNSFEVGPEVVEALKAQVTPDGLVRQSDQTHFDVDLEGWIARELEDLGVALIDKLAQCTVSKPKQYFSFRRERGLTGRQVSLIMKN